MEWSFPFLTAVIGDCLAVLPTWKDGRPRRQFVCLSNEYVGAKYEGERWSYHRLSYCLNVESIPRQKESRKDGLVLHTCDNKWCVNPEHLYLGTAKQNAIDNANRNTEWRRKRSEIQKSKGFPAVSEGGRGRMAEANSIRMKELWKDNPDQARRNRKI